MQMLYNFSVVKTLPVILLSTTKYW